MYLFTTVYKNLPSIIITLQTEHRKSLYRNTIQYKRLVPKILPRIQESQLYYTHVVFGTHFDLQRATKAEENLAFLKSEKVKCKTDKFTNYLQSHHSLLLYILHILI